MIKGQDLLIACSGRVIACSKACTLDIGADTIEVCSPTDGAYKRYIPTTIGWSVSTNGLIATAEDADALIDMVTAREEVRLSYYDTEMKMVRSGYAIPTKVQQGAQVGSIPTYTVQLQGTGELFKEEWQDVEMTLKKEIMEVAYAANKDHSLATDVTGKVQVREFELDSVSAVKTSTGRGVAVLYRLKDGETLTKLAQKIGAKDNIHLYKENELAHAYYDTAANDLRVVLAPGKYYLATNSVHTSWVSVTAVSLPVA